MFQERLYTLMCQAVMVSSCVKLRLMANLRHQVYKYPRECSCIAGILCKSLSLQCSSPENSLSFNTEDCRPQRPHRSAMPFAPLPPYAGVQAGESWRAWLQR